MIADRVSAETLLEVQLKVLLIDEQWGIRVGAPEKMSTVGYRKQTVLGPD